MLREMQFDGLVGPTHNYAGLSTGNVASTHHGGQVAHPRLAAMQGLAKMRFVHELGVDQAFLPPLDRPILTALRDTGLTGTDDDVITAAANTAPLMLAQASSASSMWTANAATIAPSCDSNDGAVHVTPANLLSKAHRALEPLQTSALLKTALPCATHHPPLASMALRDEGAANHTRLHTDQGVVHLFAYGTDEDDPTAPAPQKFPARQTRAASDTIARQHQLADDRVLLVQQHPDVIDAGVFHNDVISVGTGRVLLAHEHAFLDTDAVITMLADRLGPTFEPLVVTDAMLSVDDAVQTYLFNSQLLETPEGYVLICPADVERHAAARAVVDGWIAGSSPIAGVHYLDLRESMHNGGGPACLRLRVPLTDAERATVPEGLRINEDTLQLLEAWVQRWYPETLTADDLADPALMHTSREALADLCTQAHLGPLYPFQQEA